MLELRRLATVLTNKLFGIIVVGAAVAVVWLLVHNWRGAAEKGSTSSARVAVSGKAPVHQEKPTCNSVVVPTGTDCIAQHLANLPPDPGEAGKRTIEGVDSDQDGVRDDVQRFIALKYGHSERAVVALREIAKTVQREIVVADSVTHDQAKRMGDVSMRQVVCFTRSVDEKLRLSGAVEDVVTKVTNTPERSKQKRKFEVLAANHVYELPMDPTPVLCGYDPSKMPN